MKRILNAAQMQACDRATMEYYGMPSCVLMERAALSLVNALKDQGLLKSDALVLCGSGNNGGDGFAIARLLLLEGMSVHVIFVGQPEKMSTECKRQYEIYQKYAERLGGELELRVLGECENADLPDCELLIDALFGVGLSREITGLSKDVIAEANKKNTIRVAVDLPSGLSADRGIPLGIAFQADYTVTFAYKKLGQVLYPGRSICGKTIVTEIGIDEYSLEESFAGQKIDTAVTYTWDDLSMLPARSASSNKGSYGKVLVIAGQKNMAGAAIFASKAAYYSGCGLVYLYTEDCNREIIQKTVPEAVLITYQTESEEYAHLQKELDRAGVFVIGPGLGCEDSAKKRLLYLLQHGEKPLLLDADALNLIAANEEEMLPLLRNYKNTILMTPHLGEAARLLQKEIFDIKIDLIGSAKEIAEKYRVICVLKDAATVVSDGTCIYINESGNHGMSTGGSGDVLSGIIGSLLAQGANPVNAACLGVYLHGCAGDAAAQKYSPRAMTATDLVESIRDVLLSCES